MRVYRVASVVPVTVMFAHVCVLALIHRVMTAALSSHPFA